MPLIELENITRWFGQLLALNNVSLQLEPGLIGLLGPNGAGKSSLLKILMGLLPPSEGNGRLLDMDLRTGNVALRRKVGYMSEADALIPGLRGAEYVALAGELYGMSRRHATRRAHEVLSYLDLEEARYRRLEEYSTGMKQRIKLAQALVHDPPVLMLDEPTSGLDPDGRERMVRLLISLGKEHGKSLILSTHLLGDVERVCDKVVILFGGKVLRQGKTDELRTFRFDRYCLQIEGNPTEFLNDLRLEGVHVFPNNGTGEIRVLVPAGWVTRMFFTLADNRGILLRGLQRDDEDLEEMFHRSIQQSAISNQQQLADR